MLALHVSAAGEQPSLSELPVPAAAEGQVLIRVKAASLNALDNAIAAGMMAQMIPHEYPLVLGRDVAGTVEAVGTGVAGIHVGQDVVGHIPFAPPVQAGTLAEYAVLPAAGVTAKPSGLDFATAAAIPLAGAAAVAAVDAIGARSGQVVLVVGAGGGVGSYVVQLLAGKGVTVLATGTSADTDRLRALGAHTVIDYTSAPVAEQVRTIYPDGVDALIDLVSYSPHDLPLAAVRAGGTVASSLNAVNDDILARAGLTGTNIMANATGDTIAALAHQVVTGALRVTVSQILPFEKAADGLATLASGQSHGKIVVQVGD